jgi:hypothetical protein
VTQLEQRQTRRFELRLPFELVRAGSQRVLRLGETKNVSSKGVLFTSDSEIEIGDSVEYIITLPVYRNSVKVRLHCVGKVVRQELGPERMPIFAATVDRYHFVQGR